MSGLLDSAFAEADLIGRPTIWRSSNGSVASYVCNIELPCPIAGGKVEVSHRDNSVVSATLGAVEKARLMIGQDKTPASERLTHAKS